MNKKNRRRFQNESRPVRASGKTGSTSRGMEFNPDYTPIIKDLKRIGLLAGSFLIILIIISFFVG
jgi:hypothetical protein